MIATDYFYVYVKLLQSSKTYLIFRIDKFSLVTWYQNQISDQTQRRIKAYFNMIDTLFFLVISNTHHIKHLTRIIFF